MREDNIVNPQIRLQLNKRLYIIMICFSISLIFWLLISLSHDYPTSLKVPVVYKNIPGMKVVMNDLPTEITVHLKANGFKIFSYHFEKSRDTVTIDVSSKLNERNLNTPVLSFATQSLMVDFNKGLGKEEVVSGFEPDSIVFTFTDRISKKVPVISNASLNFASQYDSTIGWSVSPSEIIVSGPPAILDTLNFVYTESLSLTDVKTPVKQKLKIISNKLVSYNASEVTVFLPVEKFTEGNVTVKLAPVNVKPGYTLKTFPDHIQIRYVVALSNYNKVNSSMFTAVVEAPAVEQVTPGKLAVQLRSRPFYIRNLIMDPEKVDFILRKE